jgi:hypothetical protein
MGDICKELGFAEDSDVNAKNLYKVLRTMLAWTGMEAIIYVAGKTHRLYAQDQGDYGCGLRLDGVLLGTVCHGITTLAQDTQHIGYNVLAQIVATYPSRSQLVCAMKPCGGNNE